MNLKVSNNTASTAPLTSWCAGLSLGVASLGLTGCVPNERTADVGNIPGGSEVSASYVTVQGERFVTVVYRGFGAATCSATGSKKVGNDPSKDPVAVPGGSNVSASIVAMPEGDRYLVTVYRSYGVSICPVPKK
jgi:hypothetical protein